MQQELLDLVHLNSIYGIGPHIIKKIHKRYPTLQIFLQESSNTLQALGFKQEQIKAIKNPDNKLLKSVENWCSKKDNHLIGYNDPVYPVFLAQITSAPTLLYVSGNIHTLDSTMVAIVGSRNPTQYGKNIAYDLAIQLSTINITICSGLALGIDTCAHQGAVDAIGKTIAVLGCGLNHTYPKRNKKLIQAILNNDGALVSEFQPDEKPNAKNFPRRNRVISGLSSATVVVEATIKSGSLITANLAAEQGRNVLVFPGSIYSTASQGCHYLIRSGATLVSNSAEVIEELNLDLQHSLANSSTTQQKNDISANFLDKDCQKVWNALECGPFGVDSIVQLSGINIKKAMICLHKMILAGKVVESLGLYQRK